MMVKSLSLNVSQKVNLGNVSSGLLAVQNTPKFKHKHFSRELLEELYLNQQFTAKQISRIVGCCPVTVWKNLKKHGIPIRNDYYWCKGERNYFYGKVMNFGHSEETKRKIGLANHKSKRPDLAERNINDKEFIKKRLSALMKKPTSIEQKMIAIIQANSLPFSYSGNGTSVIGNKFPDFTHNSEKMVIEVFGRVFHDPKHTFIKKLAYDKTEQGTIEHYKKHGYKCLVIWDKELEKPKFVLNKVSKLLAEEVNREKKQLLVATSRR